MAVFTALTGALVGAGVSTFWASITVGAIQIAAGIGISLIGKALAGEPEKAKFGTQVQLQGGDDVPRSIILGYACTAGSLVYGNSWGTSGGVPNAYFTQVIALADYPIDSVLRTFANDSPVTLINTPHPDRGFPIQEYRKDGVDHLWIKIYDGTQTVADSFLVNQVSNAAYPYTNTRVGLGIPYVIITGMAPERRDGEENPLFSGGFPTFKFEVRGAKLYDISKDSTEGGDGLHRYDDPSTWGGDGDFFPAVQLYNVLRGIRFGGRWLYGIQNLPSARLPSDSWIAAIEKCRVPIEGPDGMEPSYRTGGEVQVGAQIKFAIESILTGCQGFLTEIGGIYKMNLGAPNASSITFNDDHIISTEQQTFTPFFGLEDTINGIQAKYPNPAEGWNTKTAPPLFSTVFEARDGNRRLLADVTLDMVPYGGQVQRLMQFALNEAQRARRHTITVGPEFWVLEPGDIVTWTSPRNGYVNKLFRVDGIGDQANLDVLLDMTEVDPTDYDWNQSEDYRPVVDAPIDIVGPPALPMIGWQVYAVAIRDEQGRERRPAIEIAYQSGLQGVIEVKFEVRVSGELLPFISGQVPYGSPWRTVIQGDFPPNSDFEVRGIFVRAQGEPSEWSSWLAVTTLDIKLIPGEDFDPFEGTVGFDSLDDDLAAWTVQIGQTPRELIEAIQNVSTHAADQESSNSLTFEELRTELAVSVGSVEANFQQVITVAIIPLQNSVVALADYVTELSAGDGSDVSTARFRMTTLSGPTGYSRIGAQTRVDNADPNAWRGAAWFLDTPVDPLLPTRFLVDAQQFIITDSSNQDNVLAPFIFEDGIAKMVAARIGTVTAGRLESSDGNSFWDLNTGAFRNST